MNELCVSCHYARMRDDVCGIYCTGGFVESNGKCKHYKDCEEAWEETGLTREEIVVKLRCCAKEVKCSPRTMTQAADLIENQQREMEALRQDNEGLRFNLAALHDSGGHPDPVGLKGALSECPVCGGPCNWEPETDTSTCTVCGYTPPKGTGSEGDEIFREALETFGAEAQITMVFEEMAELQDVLCKFLRGRVDEDTRTHIAEEIADVEIMLQQMLMLFDCAGQVETFRRYKLERLAERIKEAKQ